MKKRRGIHSVVMRVCPVTPHSCHKNGQMLAHQVIPIQLKMSNIDLGTRGSFDGRTSD